ncbi:MAG: hypothetical protein JNJ54_06385 [Myxococcaceae bacterium]|nr:hypothetical protein [Myxococcaceae bacterium]
MRALLLGVLAVVASGCIRTPIAMLTSTRPLAPGGYTELGPVEETDCLWYLFGALPISSGNNFQDAIKDAIRQRSGDALIQVTAETYYQNFLVVARYCTIVQGIAVKSR